MAEPAAPPAVEVSALARPPVRLPGAWRVEVFRQLEVLALCGLGIAQPLLDVIGRSPDFFLFHRATRTDVLLLVAVIAGLPPIVLGLLGVVSRLAGNRARAAVHILTVGALFALLAVQVGKHLLPLRGVPLLLLALVAGAVGAVAHLRWAAPGLLLRFASVGPLIFVALFVFASPASAVLHPAEHAGSGPGRATGPGGHPPVVMIVLDELPLASLLGPDGAIDAGRFPHFAELAGGSTWYRDATAVSGWTPYALPAMLSGRYPREAVPPHFSHHPDNLFTAFGGIYDIRAQESIAQLCPPSRCGKHSTDRPEALPVLLGESVRLLRQLATPSDLDVDPESAYRELTRQEAGLDAVEPVPTDPRFRWNTLDENQPARFTRFLAGLRPTARPTLHFLHLLMPHSPWTYLPSGARYTAPPDLPNDGAGWVDLARRRHLAQLGYTDRLIGQTLQVLRETGLYDDALLVVTADHGVSFTPGVHGRGMNSIRHAPGEVLWVPTFIKESGQRVGRVDGRNWEHVDLLPTVADLARIRLPWSVEGRSARDTPRNPGKKRFFDEPGREVLVPPVGPVGPAPPEPLVGTELVGRSVAELPVAGGGGVCRVDNLTAFASVDPAAGQLPALVTGTLPATVADETPIAVALNGRIAAVAPVLSPDSSGRRLAVLLNDDRLFQAGDNRLELYLVDPARRLRRIDLT